jgi:uncharacterized protein YbjQ (UPF0145 family)
MILSTTSAVAGHEIGAYLGLVVGIHLTEHRMLKSFSGAVRGVSTGQTQHTYTEDVTAGIDGAKRHLTDQAEALGADAVIGIDIDYQLVGEGSHLVLVSMSGTAVRLDRT